MPCRSCPLSPVRSQRWAAPADAVRRLTPRRLSPGGRFSF
ncbi:hypothetical protein GGE12_002101 [Rhizobium mongolense]|uniref:Uncharacterized protein n=1 Tax=Rhizobium mongolense TaxID=57676 RepID=A0A7W6WE01_9HYPH|nr:hypothetical protein [Rhizobium mongolense]